MCYIGTRSGEKIFHSMDCRYVRRMKKGNKRYFKTLKKATDAGYRQCKCCSYINDYLKKESTEIDRYCKQNGIFYYQDLNDGALDVISKAGRWKIIVNGKKHNIWLYHKSNPGIHTGDFITGYHDQKIHSHSLIGYMKYIVKHDVYRKENPLLGGKTKSARKRRRSSRRTETARTWQSINYVLDLINNMEQGNIAY